MGFPSAKRYIIVGRELSTRDDFRASIEPGHYPTLLDAADASTVQLLRLVNGHWRIDNDLHWVRPPGADRDAPSDPRDAP